MYTVISSYLNNLLIYVYVVDTFGFVMNGQRVLICKKKINIMNSSNSSNFNKLGMTVNPLLTSPRMLSKFNIESLLVWFFNLEVCKSIQNFCWESLKWEVLLRKKLSSHSIRSFYPFRMTLNENVRKLEKWKNFVEVLSITTKNTDSSNIFLFSFV